MIPESVCTFTTFNAKLYGDLEFSTQVLQYKFFFWGSDSEWQLTKAADTL